MQSILPPSSFFIRLFLPKIIYELVNIDLVKIGSDMLELWRKYSQYLIFLTVQGHVNWATNQYDTSFSIQEYSRSVVYGCSGFEWAVVCMVESSHCVANTDTSCEDILYSVVLHVMKWDQSVLQLHANELVLSFNATINWLISIGGNHYHLFHFKFLSFLCLLVFKNYWLYM